MVVVPTYKTIPLRSNWSGVNLKMMYEYGVTPGVPTLTLLKVKETVASYTLLPVAEIVGVIEPSVSVVVDTGLTQS